MTEGAGSIHIHGNEIPFRTFPWKIGLNMLHMPTFVHKKHRALHENGSFVIPFLKTWRKIPT